MKRTWIIAALLVLVGAIVVVVVVGSRQPEPEEPVTITLQVPWTDDSRIAPLADEVRLFEETYPWISVELVVTPMGDLNALWRDGWSGEAPDLAALSIETGTVDTLDGSVPWTGSPWALYANTGVLQRTEGWKEGVPEAWSDGDATVGDLESLFAELSEGGVRPLSVGGLFVWPFAAWVQHLGLAAGYDISADFGDQEPAWLADVIAQWERWLANDWVVPEWKEVDWPASLQRVLDGDAAFVLLAGNLSAAIPLESRATVLPIPFPTGDREWTVGSLISLAIPQQSNAPEAARLLLDFLTSEGVTQRLSRSMQLLFYPRSGSGPGTVHPSVSNSPESDLLQYLTAYLR